MATKPMRSVLVAFAAACVWAFPRGAFTAPSRQPSLSQGLGGARGAAGSLVGLQLQHLQRGQEVGALGAAALVAAAAVAAAAGRRARGRRGVACRAHGEDLSVPADAFVVCGVAHCFEQVEGKLKDVWVLEPISASTVEVVHNGAATSYEAFVGTTVGDILAKDTSRFPAALLCGHEVQWGDNLEFRTGCAARTWMRDHARDVVRKLAPVGQVTTGFNTSTENKRILNFVHEVKDSDNIKQDMSIDVYGRAEETEDAEAQVASLYNA